MFREASQSAEWRSELPLFAKGEYVVTPLGGSGSAALAGGSLSVKIPEARQFLWVKLEAPMGK